MTAFVRQFPSSLRHCFVALLHHIGPRDTWDYGLGVIAIGIAAFAFAGMNPAYYIGGWHTKLLLILLSGILVLIGAYALPATYRRWQALKLVIAAIAVHWAFVLPLERYWHQF